MAINERILNQVIKSGRDDLLKYLLRSEMKRLQSKKRYYNQRASTLPNNTDYDTYVRLKAKQHLIDEQITSLKKARQGLKKAEQTPKAKALLVDLSKQQKAVDFKSEAFRTYASSFDDNINETFNSMFGKGQFILSDTEISQFDKLFNKYGIGLSDTIKKAIANNYKYWASDVAYQAISEWMDKSVNTLDKINNEDKQLFKEYIATVKGRL